MIPEYQASPDPCRSTILGRLPLLLNIPAATVIVLYFSPLNPVTTDFITTAAFDDWIFWNDLTCAAGFLLGIVALFQRNSNLTFPISGMTLNLFLAAFLASLGYA